MEVVVGERTGREEIEWGVLVERGIIVARYCRSKRSC